MFSCTINWKLWQKNVISSQSCASKKNNRKRAPTISKIIFLNKRTINVVASSRILLLHMRRNMQQHPIWVHIPAQKISSSYGNWFIPGLSMKKNRILWTVSEPPTQKSNVPTRGCANFRLGTLLPDASCTAIIIEINICPGNKIVHPKLHPKFCLKRSQQLYFVPSLWKMTPCFQAEGAQWPSIFSFWNERWTRIWQPEHFIDLTYYY